MWCPTLTFAQHTSLLDLLWLSAAAVHAHPSGVLTFLLLGGLLQLLGALVFAVGLLVTVPVWFIAAAFMVHDVVGVTGVKREMQRMTVSQ